MTGRGVEQEMRKLREVLEERLPVTVQPKAEDITEDLTLDQARTMIALEHCANRQDCEGCPLVGDDACHSSLPKQALMVITKLRERPAPRAAEQGGRK